MLNAALRRAVFSLPLAASFAAADVPATVSRRLGTDVVPVAQTVHLVADARKPGYIGSVRIDLDVRRPVATFALHAEEMDVQRLALSGARGAVPATHRGGERGRLEISTPAALPAGRYTLEIDFANEFDTRATGLYKVAAGGDDYLFTQFEADEARQAFPCWDEPAFKIPYQMTVVVPEAHVAVSNTPIVTDTVKDGQRTVVFARTRPLPSYLLALATGPLEFVPIPGMSIPGRVVTVKGASALAGEAVRTTPPLLAALERYFGRPYPYEKLDLIAVPEFWPGAMENPGAITFRDSILLLDARGASAAQRRNLVTINAHELAHMWFGDLVTMEWWDDLWLNESFASWMGDKVTAEAFPEFRVGLDAVQGAQGAMNTDARLSTRAIRQPVAALDNLLQAADELAYQKGQSVLGMVEAWVGPQAFRKGVLDYLAAHEWKNATASDLWGALGRAAGKDVGGMLATFLDQPGVPMVTVEAIEGRRVRLTQKRFANHGVAAPATTWRIPVRLKYAVGSDVKTETVLLSRAAQEVVLAGPVAWVHPNVDEVGYYRWSVPAPVLQALADGGERTMSAPERVGFIGNASALLDAGALHGDDYLRLLKPFADDSEPDVVSAVIGSLAKVKNAFVTAELEPAFAGYVRSVLAPALDRFGKQRKDGEPEAVALLRPQLLLWMGRDGGDEAVLEQAARTARAYMSDPASVDPSIAGVSLQLAALRGDRALFDEYRRRAEAATIPADRGRYLGALGYFRDPVLVEAALRYTLEGKLRPQEVFTIPAAVGTSVAADGRTYRFFTENYDVIEKKLPPMYLAFFPRVATGCSVDRAAAAREFFAPRAPSIAGMDKEIVRVTELVKDCAALRVREGAGVAAYLREG